MSTQTLTAQGLVLAGFIPEDFERLNRAVALPAEAFENREDSFLFRLYREYFRAHRGVLPIQYIAHRLKDEQADVAQAVAARFQVLREHAVDDGVFEWACTRVFEDWRDSQASSALATAIRVLVGQGAVEGEGDDSHAIRGYQAMRDRLARDFARIDRELLTSTPELDLRDAAHDLLSVLGSAEREERYYFRTGIDAIDTAMPWGGFASGTLAFIAAFAGQGKTTFCTSVLAHAAIMQGFNVLYLTGETLLEEVNLKLLARHAHEAQFGLPGGFDTMALRHVNGMSQEQVEAFHAVVHDLTSRSGLDYGRFVVRQMPMRNTVDDVMATLERLEHQFPVHVLVVDSIDMVHPMPGFRGERRDRLGSVIEDFANLAISHDNGRGLIVVSPYQIKRESYERAIANEGRYDLAALSETAMAERRATVVLSLLRLPEVPTQLKAQFLKNRSGVEREFMLDVDYRSAFIGAAAGFTSADSSSALDFL